LRSSARDTGCRFAPTGESELRDAENDDRPVVFERLAPTIRDCLQDNPQELFSKL